MFNNIDEENKFHTYGLDVNKAEFEESFMNSYTQPNYNDEMMGKLLSLLSTDPPFRAFTLKMIANIVYELSHHNSLKMCLHEDDFSKLVNIY